MAPTRNDGLNAIRSSDVCEAAPCDLSEKSVRRGEPDGGEVASRGDGDLERQRRGETCVKGGIAGSRCLDHVIKNEFVAQGVWVQVFF